jgi:hypothetical protein
MDLDAHRGSGGRLIDGFAAEADAREVHEITIDASRPVVWRALWTADLDRLGVVKVLFGLRSLPRLLVHRREAWRLPSRLTLPLLIGRGGFGILAEAPEREIVMGIAGRFWRPTGAVLPFVPERFLGALPAGTAKAVWNFTLEDAGGDRTILATETRVVCADAAARRRFRLYWLAIRPWSGLIRIALLRAVGRAATDAQRAHSRQTPV